MLRNVKKTDDVYLSYGRYMSYLIARGIQVVVVNNRFRRKDELLIFSTLTDIERGEVYKKTLAFVLVRMAEDLML